MTTFENLFSPSTLILGMTTSTKIEGVFMHKEESYYNTNGEKVFSRTTRFTGRFHEDRGYLLYVHGQTISSRIIDFPQVMSKIDIANLSILSRHLQPNTNVLAYRGNKGKLPMDIDRIAKVLNVEERQTKRFIKKMMELHMMKVTIIGDETRYIINPLYFHNGKSINDSLYWLFQEQLDVHLPKWAIEKYRKRKEGGA